MNYSFGLGSYAGRKVLVSEVYRLIRTGQGDPRHVQNEFCNDFSFPDNEHTDALIEAS